MQVIEQSWSWVKRPENALDIIEIAGRTCYKSEAATTALSNSYFAARLLSRGHLSVIEHATASVRFITNRGVTHELVRHRLASFSQESTRYVNYGGGEMVFIMPVWAPCPDDLADTHDPIITWQESMMQAEQSYKALLDEGWRPEQAREVLPNSLKTEIVVTANLREWMHIFKLRCSKAAHPQIRALMIDCLQGFRKEVPVIFDNIQE